MKNKKYTIKYSKPNHSNTNTNTNTHEAQLTNTHPLIKTSIRKTIATCLTFSLVVSVIGYAQALNKTGENNSSKDNVSFIETTSPHYIAIKNFQTQKENYWDISNIENIGPDRIFYVDMSKMVENNTENNDEPVYIFSDMSVQYSKGQTSGNQSSGSQTSEPEHTELTHKRCSQSKTSTYRYAYLIHLTDSERHVVESIIAGESGNQPFVGKKLVAQAVYNGMLRDNMSPSQVRKQYSYDGYKDIDEFEKECLKAYGNTNAADECRQAVKEIFDNYSMPTDDFVLFFYAPAHSKGTWHENAKTLKPITYVNEDGSTTNYIGGHKFFALKNEPVINYTREG